MLQRLKDNIVYDTVYFNQEQSRTEKQSDDVLAQKIQTNDVKIFGLKTQQIETYQSHIYYSQQILIQTTPTDLIRTFIQGYYGIDDNSIINFKRDNQADINSTDANHTAWHTFKENEKVLIRFSIESKFNQISQIERLNKLGYYRSMSSIIKSYVPMLKVFDLKLKQNITIFKNTIDESEYINIFNQLSICEYDINCIEVEQYGYKQMKQDINGDNIHIYLTCVKYNNNTKGRIYYPTKFYGDLPAIQDNSLIIQYTTSHQLTTLIFKEDKIVLKQQLIIRNLRNFLNPFGIILGQIRHQHQVYQVQIDYVNQTIKDITKKIKQISFLNPRKTHGNQYNMKGLKYDTNYEPRLRITFFPKTTYVQLQCEADSIETVLFNFTIIMNYFNLQDKYEDFYDDSITIKKDRLKQYKQKLQLINHENEPNYDHIGTHKFDIGQNRSYQDAILDDLQLIDPISYGVDDRYEYQKLVTDIQKRPIQFKPLDQNEWGQVVGVDKQAVKHDVKQRKDQRKDKQAVKRKVAQRKDKQAVKREAVQHDGGHDDTAIPDTTILTLYGSGKGSPVYINSKQDFSKFLYYQHLMIARGFSLRNQTFQSIQNSFICSKNFPYLLLGNTNGKDSVSCAKDPLNQYGLSIFEFHDVAQRALADNNYIAYLRQFLYGRVSNSAVRFQKWVMQGRCSEIPVNLKKLFSQNTLMLSVLMKSDLAQSDVQYKLRYEIDYQWFKSVFGQEYDTIFDGDVIYDYSDNQFYSNNPDGKQLSLWIQFNNHKKYLMIYDDIKIEYDEGYNETNIKRDDGHRKHYYIPYYFQDKLYKKPQKYDVDFYKKRFDVIGYVNTCPNEDIYLITKQGSFPVVDMYKGIKCLNDVNLRDRLPDYQTVVKLINSFDNYIINYKGNIIGGNYNKLRFFWKETNFKTQQTFVIGTYPIHCDVQGDKYAVQCQRNQVVAYNIYQYLSQYKYYTKDNIITGDDDEPSLKGAGRKKKNRNTQDVKNVSYGDKETFAVMNKILGDVNLVLKIFKMYGRYVNDPKRLNDEIFQKLNNYKHMYMFTSMTKEYIVGGYDWLLRDMPNTDQMKYDFIKGMSRFSRDKQLQYEKFNIEEIYVNNNNNDFDRIDK